MRIAAYIGMWLLVCQGVWAQDYYAPAERFRFASGSYEIGEYAISLYECDALLATFPEASFLDSVRFLAGQNLVRLGKWEAVDPYLEAIRSSENSPELYPCAGIGLGYRSLQTGEYAEARSYAARAETIDYPELAPYGNLVTTAALLLEKEYMAFDTAASTLNFNQFEVQKAVNGLTLTRNEYAKIRRKSPALAGTLSGVIPGMGQAYSKRWGNGVTYFLFCGIMAAQSWEGYNKGGFRDPQFIIFSTAFLGLYIANIYGSVIHTKRYNAKIETDFRNRVLVEVALPVESLFRSK